MDNPHEDIERELQALRPRPPSTALWQRLERELADPAAAPKPRYRSATTLTSWKWAGWQIAAAAAAVAILATAGVMRLASPTAPETASPANLAATPRSASPQVASTAPAAADLYRPVKATNVLYDMADEGLVRIDNDLEARRTRYRFVDTITWKNQAGNATVRWSIPREEVRFIPVSQN
jgi:hypothetical protein